MATVAIIGAHGKVGQRIVRLLAERGDTAIGVVRGDEQADRIRALGGQAALLDLEHSTAAQLGEAIEGAEAVVFSAGAGGGSGPERKRTVDYGASVLLQEAADAFGITRFVQVSAIGVDDEPAADAAEDWTAYVPAKREADERLRASGLDWTILRPGGLTDEVGTGRVRIGERVDRGSIPRDDVAALVIACLDEPATIGRQWEAVAGDDLIDAAIDAEVTQQLG